MFELLPILILLILLIQNFFDRQSSNLILLLQGFIILIGVQHYYRHIDTSQFLHGLHKQRNDLI